MEVSVDAALPVLFRHLPETIRLRVVDASVDQDVYVAKGGDGLVEHTLGLAGLSHVGAETETVAALGEGGSKGDGVGKRERKREREREMVLE